MNLSDKLNAAINSEVTIKLTEDVNPNYPHIVVKTDGVFLTYSVETALKVGTVEYTKAVRAAMQLMWPYGVANYHEAIIPNLVVDGKHRQKDNAAITYTKVSYETKELYNKLGTPLEGDDLYEATYNGKFMKLRSIKVGQKMTVESNSKVIRHFPGTLTHRAKGGTRISESWWCGDVLQHSNGSNDKLLNSEILAEYLATLVK